MEEAKGFETIAYAETFATRLLGLMGKSDIPEGYALVFPNCRSIHTHFMKCPIDVAYIDEEGCVLGVETLKPWKVGHAPKDTKHVVECAAGQAHARGLVAGAPFGVALPQSGDAETQT